MSAALSHEFNQPLAAIRSYADNALLLIERSREAEAVSNLRRIKDLTGRMAEISKHLMTFARKPRRELHPVLLAEVLDDRSEEHTSELQSLMRISYAVFCLKKKNTRYNTPDESTNVTQSNYRNIH